MHADGKSTLASVSKWNPGKVNSIRDLKQTDAVAERWRSISKFLFRRTQGQVNLVECNGDLNVTASSRLPRQFE